MSKKPLDEALDKIEADMLEQAKREDNFKPLLDAQLKKVQKIDNFIKWHEDKIAAMESDKQYELRRMGDLMDSAMVNSHSLSNGYTVKPDNKRKVVVKDIGAFMKWLKQNKTSSEVFEFFKDAMKLSNLKKFCEKEANQQRLNGELAPSVDGVEFGDITYRRLTTEIKKPKKGKPLNNVRITSEKYPKGK